MKFYVVAHGRHPGIYLDYKPAWNAVNGFPAWRMQSFPNIFRAVAFYELYKNMPKGTGVACNEKKVSEKENELRKTMREEELMKMVTKTDDLKEQVFKTELSDLQKGATPEEAPLRPLAETITTIRNWTVFTDGCYHQETRTRGYAALLFYGNAKYPITLSGTSDEGESYEMELTAICKAMKRIDKVYTEGTVNLYSDCKTIVDILNTTSRFAEWKKKYGRKQMLNGHKKQRIKLWKRIYKLAGKMDISFFWVKAHRGNDKNIWCDGLANLEANLAEKRDRKPPAVGKDAEKGQ